MNGLDWPMEGGDRRYRVEMDVGELLGNWMTAGSTRELLLGVVRDNMGGTRRANIVVGVIEPAEGKGEDVCARAVNNLPAGFSIRLFHYHNPQNAILFERALVILPGLTFYLGNGKQRTLVVNPNGVLNVPESFIRSLSERVEVGNPRTPSAPPPASTPPARLG
jgi:hypothetical protein